MEYPAVNIHTHRPTGRGIELRAAGIHPWHAGSEAVEAVAARLDAVQALGEIGLDALRGPAMEIQLATFREQLRLAAARRLPVVLHCVRAFEPTMRELRACPAIPAVIFHGFIGSPEQARQALERGYFLSFGERSFGSPRTAEALRRMPLDRLFLETDESPTPIEAIYARAAALLQIDRERLQRALYENYERIFTHGQLVGANRAAAR